MVNSEENLPEFKWQRKKETISNLTPELRWQRNK